MKANKRIRDLRRRPTGRGITVQLGYTKTTTTLNEKRLHALEDRGFTFDRLDRKQVPA